ncbi:hypothetical protein BDM02DRAFT_3129468 [Thelephora ganbajun]|uniref:Uncharacterized protein n=1 Tax=Thelephora ganbajun TaxID=370292 RepID=A0ACB6ZE86_THEGA|nr:hypothetical protein BDM02DRAFT_3129468 [Thelephora ganbajun]
MANGSLSVELRAGGSWSVSQTRYLHREWNRRSPEVRKYHSVPVLRLVPSDRPLFFCDNCCSANFYVPICLWCKWTSAAAIKGFEEKIPRGRTMSTPRLCPAGLERMKKGRLGGGIVPENFEPRRSLDTSRSTEPPETPRSLFQHDNSPVIAARDEWVKLSVDEATLSFSDPYHGGRLRNRKQRLSAVDDSRDSIVSFNRSAHVPWSDDGHGYESQSFSDDESQGLRRSTDSRCSGTKSEGHVPRLARNPTRTRKTVVQLSSSPPSFHRRPLYHYIRNKASTSQSTFDCGAVPEITLKRPITPQHGAGHLTWQSTEASSTYVDELSLPTLVPPITSFSRKGFSLSGETEQRMDLEKIVHDGRFVFHENKPTRKRDRIMRGLRRSFKSFFNTKADKS